MATLEGRIAALERESPTGPSKVLIVAFAMPDESRIVTGIRTGDEWMPRLPGESVKELADRFEAQHQRPWVVVGFYEYGEADSVP